MAPLLARPLLPGQTIGLVSPAAPSPLEMLDRGQALLEAQGYRVKRMPHAAENHHGYLAGTDAQRLSDLHQAFADPTIDAILCCRGGYGCTRLLPELDFNLIQANPKLLMGFSDITALLNAIYLQTGLVGYYSPMLTSNLALDNQEWSWQQWLRLLNPSAQQFPMTIETQDPYTCFHPGMAEGPLLGGNLSLLVALCGTPWQPDFTGAVVFIEDWKERFYSLDRQLTQLKQAGLFDSAAGLLFCDFSECPSEYEFDLVDHLRWLTHDLGIPCGYGFTVGHGDQTATIPVGGLARLDASSGQLTLLTAPVQLSP